MLVFFEKKKQRDVEKVHILKKIKMLQSNKATQNTDIPTN